MLEKAIRLAAAVAVIFGAATVIAGGRVLFGDGAAQAGDYVGFVVWFNFLAGFVYVAAGIALWLRWHWAPVLALGLALATAVVFAAFGAHILGGGAFEARTIAAMSLRTLVWFSIAGLALFALRRA
jgi:hypothetical protein